MSRAESIQARVEGTVGRLGCPVANSLISSCPSVFTALAICRNTHETHLSTFSGPSQEDARFSGSHENCGWPRRHQCPPRQGPCSRRGLTACLDRRYVATPVSGPTGRFAEVVRRGKRYVSPRLTLCILEEPTTGSCEVSAAEIAAWSIQKKFLKSAVLRNAVKRQLREALRARPVSTGKRLVILGRRPFISDTSSKRNLKQEIRREADGLLDRVFPRP